MNADIAQMLRRIAHLRGLDTYSGAAYATAAVQVGALGYSLRERLHTTGAIGRISGVGTKISACIREFITTGRSSEEHQLLADADAIAALIAIKGVGRATADEWVGKGIRSVDALRQAMRTNAVVLTQQQQYGLEYYDDLRERIPRADVAVAIEHIRDWMRAVCGDSATTVVGVGSYRRGHATSGDVDVIVSRTRVVPTTMTRLREHAVSIGALVMAAGSERLQLLWRGNNPRMRQIDILCVPQRQFAAALLYFTGSFEFNVSMRRYAAKKGFRLNQHGLYRVDRRGRVSTAPIVTPDERAIFDALGLHYVEPYEREGAIVVTGM